MDPLDFILTNSLPTIFTFLLVPKISLFQFDLIIVYKSFIEIGGHCGKIINGSSFQQFIWIPKCFNKSLYIYDHDLHHSLNNYNFSKRFSFWDKLFNTYKLNKIIKNKVEELKNRLLG